MQNDHQFFFRLEILTFLYAFDEACHGFGKSEKNLRDSVLKSQNSQGNQR